MSNNRSVTLALLNKSVLAAQGMLNGHGFQEHRLGEWLNYDTLRHVRMGYAGGEWVIHVSKYPERGYAGVAQVVMEPLREIRFDSRMLDDTRPVPTPRDLVSQIVA